MFQIARFRFARNGNATTTYRIRVAPLEGNPWFSLADACGALELQPDKAGGTSFYNHAARLRPDTRRTVTKKTPGCEHGLFHGTSARMVLISEAGLYELIARSNKPEARAFKDWVFGEVLPTIRKTGGYVLQGADRATVGEGTVPRCRTWG